MTQTTNDEISYIRPLKADKMQDETKIINTMLSIHVKLKSRSTLLSTESN